MPKSGQQARGTRGSQGTHAGTIEVEIYGTLYSLRGGSDPASVRALAADLDARMRDLAEPDSGAEPAKVAILAALRLADEARSAREDAQAPGIRLAGTLEALSRRLGAALEATHPTTSEGIERAGHPPRQDA